MLSLRYGKIEQLGSKYFGKMSFNNSRLPKGYTELECVANLSNSYPTYLVLNHKFNSSHSKLTIDCYNATSRKIAGCKADGTRGKGFDLGNAGYYFGDYYGSIDIGTEITHIEIGKMELYVNGDLVFTSTKQPDNTSPNNLAIGVCYGSGSTLNISNGTHLIGEVKVEYDDEVLFDLIPCKNPDGIVGFYDIINDEFRRSESGYDWNEPSLMNLLGEYEDGGEVYE